MRVVVVLRKWCCGGHFVWSRPSILLVLRLGSLLNRLTRRVLVEVSGRRSVGYSCSGDAGLVGYHGFWVVFLKRKSTNCRFVIFNLFCSCSFATKPCSFATKTCNFATKTCSFATITCSFATKTFSFASKTCSFATKMCNFATKTSN